MKITKKSFLVTVCAIMMLFVVCFAMAPAAAASADADAEEQIVQSEGVQGEEVVPYGWFTNLSISINGGNGKVWTTVRNDFTLFPAVVTVVIQLYVSDTYQEDYHNMTIAAQDEIADLDMGKSITVEASTNGKDLYWIGRMRYDLDGRGWDERTVGPAHYSASGEYLGVL